MLKLTHLTSLCPSKEVRKRNGWIKRPGESLCPAILLGWLISENTISSKEEDVLGLD